MEWQRGAMGVQEKKEDGTMWRQRRRDTDKCNSRDGVVIEKQIPAQGGN